MLKKGPRARHTSTENGEIGFDHGPDCRIGNIERHIGLRFVDQGDKFLEANGR